MGNKKILVSLVNHELTNDQKEDLNLQGIEIIQLPGKWRKFLRQCPAGIEKLGYAAYEICMYAEELDNEMSDTGEIMGFLAPGGSPAFMALFMLQTKYPTWFSHSERKSAECEEKGVVTKVNSFKHICWQVIPPWRFDIEKTSKGW